MSTGYLNYMVSTIALISVLSCSSDNDSLSEDQSDDLHRWITSRYVGYDSVGNVQYYETRDKLIHNELGMYVTYSESGLDNVWFTNDDKVSTYQILKINSNNKKEIFAYCSAGTDGVVFSSDDSCWDYEKTEYNSQDKITKLVIKSLGSDGIIETEDDGIYGYDSYIYENGFLNLTTISYVNSGSDGVWFTIDDEICCYTLSKYDKNGNKNKEISYWGNGNDGKWFTDDDESELSYEYVEYNNLNNVVLKIFHARTPLSLDFEITKFTRLEYSLDNKLIRKLEFGLSGDDSNWLTEDDVLSRFTRYEYNVDGYKDVTISFSSNGLDNIWFTNDDVIEASRITEFDENRYPSLDISYVGPGEDQVWFNEDDVVEPPYYVYEYDAFGNMNLFAPFFGAGIDLNWRTYDDSVGLYERFYYEQNELIKHVRYHGIDEDGIALTEDDPVFDYWYRYNDGEGLYKWVYYNAFGNDDNWFTTDDIVGIYSKYRFTNDGNERFYVSYSSSGNDGEWFTADDKKSSETESFYCTGKLCEHYFLGE